LKQLEKYTGKTPGHSLALKKQSSKNISASLEAYGGTEKAPSENSLPFSAQVQLLQLNLVCDEQMETLKNRDYGTEPVKVSVLFP